MPTAPTVFISYSHQDEVWKDRLLDHLGGLEEEGLLKVWSDRNIGAGDEWLEEIRTAMSSARVAVFLVSAHSLKSKFIRHQEIPPLLDRREKEGMTFFPVIVRSCAWDVLPWLSRFQARPLDGRPLAGFQGNRRDAELTKIAKEILSIVRNGVQHSQFLKVPDISKLTAPLHQRPTSPVDFAGRDEDLDFLRSKLSQGHTGAIFGPRDNLLAELQEASHLENAQRTPVAHSLPFLDLSNHIWLIDPLLRQASNHSPHCPESSEPKQDAPQWDIFLSYLSEDSALAKSLREELENRGLTVWHDQKALRIGKSLKHLVDSGFKKSRFVVVIISKHLLKRLSRKELDSLAEEEVDGRPVIFPVWHDISIEIIRDYSPSLADKIAVTSNLGTSKAAEAIANEVRLRASGRLVLEKNRKGEKDTILFESANVFVYLAKIFIAWAIDYLGLLQSWISKA
jgi:TIR domain-containing protein